MASKDAIFEELLTVGSLLEYGFASLERARPGFYPDRGDPPFVPLYLLSTSLERLGKCVLWLEGQRRDDPPDLKSLGHYVDKIVARICDQCYRDEMLVYPAVKEDRDFLSSDPVVTRFIELMTTFAGPGLRYFYLDAVNEDPPIDNTSSPENRWHAWEREFTRRIEGFTALDDWNPSVEPATLYARKLVRQRVAFVERIVRAFARHFAPSMLGEDAWMLCTGVAYWGRLPDEGLGKRTYSATPADFLRSTHPDVPKWEPQPAVGGYRIQRLRDFPPGPKKEMKGD